MFMALGFADRAAAVSFPEALDHFFASWYNAPIGNEGEQCPGAAASREKGWPQAGSRPKQQGEIRSGAAALKEK
jgi:hypothetical protein